MTTIKSVGVFSLAKVMGFTGVLMGILMACGYGLVFLVLDGVSQPKAPGAGLWEGLGLALLAAIPILYGIGSFLVGLVYGVCANVVLFLSGGLEVELAERGPR